MASLHVNNPLTETNMNAKTNDGGPAFPMVETVNSNAALCDIHHPEAMIISTGGMSLRAWLAGQSMMAAAMYENDKRPTNKPPTDADVAKRAVSMADAVIAELEKEAK